MTTLDASLSIALTGLRASAAGLRTVANNVANADTAGYTRKVQVTLATTPDDAGMGVQLGSLQRNVDATLQREVFARTASVTALETRETLLQGIETVHGTPESGTSLAGLLATLTDSFNALAADPSSATTQQEVVRTAEALATKLNDLSNAVTDARNQAQEQISNSVKATNSALAEIDRLTVQIRNAIASGQQVPDLEDQRDAALQKFTTETGARYLIRQDGSILLTGPSGITWPTTKAKGASEGPLTVTSAEISATSTYGSKGGTVPGVILTDPGNPLAPRDITGVLNGGRLGELIELRDSTLPTMQAELDEFAKTLARRFDQQGLRLFSDAQGNVPTESIGVVQANYVGFASTIRVFPAVEQDVSLVRDGTHSIPGGLPAAPATVATSNPQGSVFTPNPANGPEGFDSLARRIITYALGGDLKAGVAHDPQVATRGLGAAGNLSSEIPPHATLADFASSLVSVQTEKRAKATEAKSAETTSRDLLLNRLSDEAGVNVDQEMSLMVQLQNAYQASARVLQTNRELWDTLYQATQG